MRPRPPAPPALALPRRFRRPRLLIVGCGDVGQRVLTLLAGRWSVRALTSSAERLPALRAAGAVPLIGDLDRAPTLRRLAGLASRVLHLAPPPTHRDDGRDPRTAALLQALSRHDTTRRLVYGSTSGVYGDAQGRLIDETWGPRALTARARRRVDAERAIARWVRRQAARAAEPARSALLLRIPGIYALDREGGNPLERLRRGTPLLEAQDDVHTNHIQADDLARACFIALLRGPGGARAINVNDDSDMKMGDYFDLAARLAGLAPAPRISRAEATQRLGPMQLSFMSESRRMDNSRMKRELRLSLRHPTVASGLADLQRGD
ncbi:nucleoside-diphosphate-sugar epimerase [Sphaerotilus hippei]|uniref:Nucleoside-diphosphate-sugar epimerase n=1 Tax=Sphaerotilus hippei TaxID=744406 RepID=A0A318H4V3_9BURK|nr:NAD(P)H-binding protein [Sphaerotilus hippei]PXW94172.1 nucleoside-diphosphate-sugar epimerase [Sphaerotilus hippei]